MVWAASSTPAMPKPPQFDHLGVHKTGDGEDWRWATLPRAGFGPAVAWVVRCQLEPVMALRGLLSGAVAFVACASCGGGEAGVGGGVPWDDKKHEGEGTYYGANGSGACSFDPSSDLDVAALNAPDWNGSAYCGGCVDVTGPKGKLRVKIVDLCPECAEGDLDLSESAFAKIAEPAAGRVPISWTFVSCDISGSLSYRYKEGSSQWWTALQVRNSRYPIAKLEWSADGETFVEMVREDYNYFVDEAGLGTSPVTLRVTAVTGEVVTEEIPAPADGLVVSGSEQFE
jgi:expansin